MSIFKRLFGERDDSNNSANQIFKTPQNANVKSIGQSLQKKFSRGVQYNMKILIRGDRNVGKSTLLARLKGLDFVEHYIPTDEIEVACIHWSYKGSDDVVKVEVWDVVDKGRKKKSSSLKLENCPVPIAEGDNAICLDSDFLDVYKGAHGVIMMFDMTKLWTLQYIERELPRVPHDIPVLVLANHRDMGHHRTVSKDQVMEVISSVLGDSDSIDASTLNNNEHINQYDSEKPIGNRRIIRYWESSMQNGYGLLFIHRFLNLPFLRLQRFTLLNQLLTNNRDTDHSLDELGELEHSTESCYDNFIQMLKSNKTSKPTSLAINSTPTSQINSPVSPVGNQKSVKSKQQPSKQQASTPSGNKTMNDTSITSTTNVTGVSNSKPLRHVPQARPIPGMERLGLYPTPVPNSTNETISDPVVNATDQSKSPHNKTTTDRKGIFDFVPDDQPNLSGFLDDPISVGSTNTRTIRHQSSSQDINSDEDEDEEASNDSKKKENQSQVLKNKSSPAGKKSNPMVAAFIDDIDELDDGIIDVNESVSNPVVMCNDASSSSDDMNISSRNINKINASTKRLDNTNINTGNTNADAATVANEDPELEISSYIDIDEGKVGKSKKTTSKSKKKSRKKKDHRDADDFNDTDKKLELENKKSKRKLKSNQDDENKLNDMNGDISDSLERFLNE